MARTKNRSRMSLAVAFGSGVCNVHSVTISGVAVTSGAACTGKKIGSIPLYTHGAAITKGTGSVASISAASMTVILTTDASARDVAQISVVIH